MQVLKFEDRFDWLQSRRGKITGSTLKDVVSVGGPTKEAIVRQLELAQIEFKKTAKKEELEKLLPKESMAELNAQLPKKLGFYELIAQRLGVPPDEENSMERGSRLESEAVERFATETGKEVDASLLIWTRDDNESIAISPDAVVIGESAAVEAKCLKSALHIKAYLTGKIPEEYELQALQYFVVNDDLATLYFVFYDPRFAMFSLPGSTEARKRSLDYFVIEFKRSEVGEQAKAYLEQEQAITEEVDLIVNQLTF